MSSDLAKDEKRSIAEREALWKAAILPDFAHILLCRIKIEGLDDTIFGLIITQGNVMAESVLMIPLSFNDDLRACSPQNAAVIRMIEANQKVLPENDATCAYQMLGIQFQRHTTSGRIIFFAGTQNRYIHSTTWGLTISTHDMSQIASEPVTTDPILREAINLVDAIESAFPSLGIEPLNAAEQLGIKPRI
jgi:hypothetical protein